MEKEKLIDRIEKKHPADKAEGFSYYSGGIKYQIVNGGWRIMKRPNGKPYFNSNKKCISENKINIQKLKFGDRMHSLMIQGYIPFSRDLFKEEFQKEYNSYYINL